VLTVTNAATSPLLDCCAIRSVPLVDEAIALGRADAREVQERRGSGGQVT
jgi:hypothetical protein